MANIASISKKFELITDLACLDQGLLTPEDIVRREELENSLYEFSKEAWTVINPGFKYVDGWHIPGIAGHLEAAYYGRIKRLIINIPSRCMKSTLCNIFFPAWAWAKEPHLKFLNISSNSDLSERDNIICRQLIVSKWYQRYWGHKVQVSKDLNTKDRYSNTSGGVKIVKTIHGSSMGEGGNFILVDDPNTYDDIIYATKREYANATIDATVGIRVDSISEDREGCLIIIQQRVHQFDLTGHWLAKNDPNIVHLMLPMKYEHRRRCITIPINGSKTPWQDPRKEEGELLWPIRINDAKVLEREKSYGTAINIAAQHQQNPTPAGGNLIKQEWFRWWKQDSMPECDMIIQSWDTALSDSETACESAHTTWGVFKDENGYNNLILLNSWSGRLADPDLRKMMVKSAKNYWTTTHKGSHIPGPAPDIILVEEAMNGKALISNLQLSGIQNVIGFNPRTHGMKVENGSSPTKKLARTNFASMIIETRIVWLPLVPESQFTRLYGFADKFLEACLRCPRGDGQDIIDSMAQAFIWARMRGIIHFSGENPDPTPITFDHEEILDPTYTSFQSEIVEAKRGGVRIFGA